MNQVNLLLDTPLGWFECNGTTTHITGSRWVLADDAVIGSGLRSVLWKEEVEKQVAEYFAGERLNFNLPFSWDLPEAHQLTCEAMQHIPVGEVISVEALIDRYMLQSIRRSDLLYTIGANPFALFVPAHRVDDLQGGEHAMTQLDRINAQLREHEGFLMRIAS